MSKSLARVVAAMQAHGVAGAPLEMPGETRTAEQAAAAAGCSLDQIVKSIIFGGTGGMYLFLTAGGNQVDSARASALAGEALGRADANQVRAVTGFAIGGISPLGHLTPLPLWMDPALLAFPQVWAAAGTPRHIFAIPPLQLQQITGAVVAEFTV